MSNKSTKQKTKKTNKPKVFIPAYKIIILCAAVITVCMILLLVTTLLSGPKRQESISGRYKENIPDNPNNIEQYEEVREDIEQKKTEIKDITVNKETLSSDKKEIPDNTEPESTVSESNADNLEVLKGFTKEKEETAVIAENKKGNKEEKYSITVPKAVNNAQLVFVFDDGGHNINQTKAFLDIPFPFTVAVLPRLPFSKESADLVRNSGNEVILHQPMQAVNMNIDPGPGAITPDMTENDIISTLFQNITEIGPIAGMNNHEGSAITADAEKMAVILRFASQEGIFFLDSRTNADTKVPYVAGELGYSYYERNIFLDNEKTRKNILTELSKGLNIANKKGSVIMIGHIWSADILPAILKEIYPELNEKGYTFSVVSKSKAVKN